MRVLAVMGLVLFLLAQPAMTQEPVNIAGVWLGTIGLGGRSSGAGLFRAEVEQSGNTFVGTQVISPNGLYAWKGTINGDQITSKASTPEGLDPTTLEGTISGNEMAGRWKNDKGPPVSGGWVLRRPREGYDYLIVPGQRIGKWTLVMTIDDLLKMNGPRQGGYGSHDPLMQWPAQDYASPDFWEHHWDQLDVLYAITQGRDSQKVRMLVIEHPAYRTANGIGPGLMRDAFEAAYGRPTAVTVTKEGFSTLIFDQAGLGAWLNERFGAIAAVIVFEPGTARTIWRF